MRTRGNANGVVHPASGNRERLPDTSPRPVPRGIGNASSGYQERARPGFQEPWLGGMQTPTRANTLILNSVLRP
jgi:hypothetical protein